MPRYAIALAAPDELAGPVMQRRHAAMFTTACRGPVHLTWHHVQDPDRYRRDRIQDAGPQRAFVLRFVSAHVDDRLASTIDQIALALAGRRAQRAQSGGDSQ